MTKYEKKCQILWLNGHISYIQNAILSTPNTQTNKTSGKKHPPMFGYAHFHLCLHRIIKFMFIFSLKSHEIWGA